MFLLYLKTQQLNDHSTVLTVLEIKYLLKSLRKGQTMQLYKITALIILISVVDAWLSSRRSGSSKSGSKSGSSSSGSSFLSTLSKGISKDFNNGNSNVYLSSKGAGITHKIGSNPSLTLNANAGWTEATGTATFKNGDLKVDLSATVGYDGKAKASLGLSYRFKKKRGIMIKQLPTLPLAFDLYDEDHNGLSTVEEFEKQLMTRHYSDRRTLYTVMDRNVDGNVSEDEFMVVAKQLANSLLFPECIPDERKGRKDAIARVKYI